MSQQALQFSFLQKTDKMFQEAFKGPSGGLPPSFEKSSHNERCNSVFGHNWRRSSAFCQRALQFKRSVIAGSRKQHSGKQEPQFCVPARHVLQFSVSQERALQLSVLE